MLEHSRINTLCRESIFRGTPSHSGFQYSICTIPEVSDYSKLLSSASHSGVSGRTLCMLALANLQCLHSYRVLLIGAPIIQHYESIHSGAPGIESIHSSASENILNCNTGLPFPISRWTIEVTSPDAIKACHELHPARLCATLCSILPVILLQWILFLLLIYSLPHSPTVNLHYGKWNLCPARWGFTIHRRFKKQT